MTITVSVEYLIPRLRLYIGDTDPDTYKYMDEWLVVSLLAGVETLQRWWNYKYLIDDNDLVYRNPTSSFVLPEPPVIEPGDVRPIVLMAAIVVKSGDLENMSWKIGAWRDAEISYSNVEGGRGKREGIQRDWDELRSLLLPPVKKLAFPMKSHLPGYKNNSIER